jgi:Fic family protein
MEITVSLLIGLVIGLCVGYFIGRRNVSKTLNLSETLINDAEKIKSVNIAKIKDYLSNQTDNEIHNEDVRELLKVSDSTACRYLDDLETEGLIKQIGSDGPKVYYKKS